MHVAIGLEFTVTPCSIRTGVLTALKRLMVYPLSMLLDTPVHPSQLVCFDLSSGNSTTSRPTQ